MVSAHDVAAYILAQKGPMTTMKLQKLVYYSQAWHLVWTEAPLFEESIQAWANGPVVRELYERHRGKFTVEDWPEGDAGRLDEGCRESIDAVITFYGDKTAQWLSDLTHREAPWMLARQGLAAGERGDHVISHADLHEYYSGLVAD